MGVGAWRGGRKGGAIGEGSGEGGKGSSMVRVFQKFNSIQLKTTKTTTNKQGAVLLWSWRARKIMNT